MIKISFGSSFKNIFKKKIKKDKNLEKIFWERIEIFINNPYDDRLRTHKLSGNLKDLRREKLCTFQQLRIKK